MFRDRITADIKRFGRSIIGVGAGDDQPPFAYTIGNGVQWPPLPELLVIGFAKSMFLNDLSRLMIARAAAFDDGELVRLVGSKVPVKVIRASDTAKSDFTIGAGRYYGHERYDVMQVLIPDFDGVFPGEPGCQSPFDRVPVLAMP